MVEFAKYELDYYLGAVLEGIEDERGVALYCAVHMGKFRESEAIIASILALDMLRKDAAKKEEAMNIAKKYHKGFLTVCEYSRLLIELLDK